MQYDKNTQDKMFAMVALWKRSGLSQKAWCEQNQMGYHVFHYWYKLYRDKQSNSGEAAFIPLTVKPSLCDTSLVNIEVVLADGKRILFHQAVSSDFLKAVIS